MWVTPPANFFYIKIISRLAQVVPSWRKIIHRSVAEIAIDPGTSLARPQGPRSLGTGTKIHVFQGICLRLKLSTLSGIRVLYAGGGLY